MGNTPTHKLFALEVSLAVPESDERARIHLLPVLHERLEFADVVRLAYEQLAPDAAIVEVPSSLSQLWRRAIDRLPQVSVLLYENRAGQTVCLPVHPADPMAEAGRCARQRDIPLTCADLDVDGYADYRDPIPDSYAVSRVGLEKVYRAFEASPRAADPHDLRREAAMAHHVQEAVANGARQLLVVVGMHHAKGLAAALKHPQAAPMTPPRRANARLLHLHPESLSEILSEIPFYIAVYEARRQPIPEEEPQDLPTAAGRSYGPFRVLTGGAGDRPERARDAVLRAARRSGWADWTGWLEGRPAGSWSATTVPGPLDRLRVQWALLREAEAALESAAPDERVSPWQRSHLARYTRNLARLSGQLVVDLFDLLVASRGCVSENYAWETHRLATSYPAQADVAADAATARIRAEELFDGVRRIRISRSQRRTKRPKWDRLLRRRRDERFPGEWLLEFDSDAICSYPPEDVIIEEFGRYLKKRGKLILSEERARSTPFSTSVLDGIDVRETIRHWTDEKIYVRELGRVPGGIGSVVVIFDEDDEGEKRFPHCQTWIGEHDQESDMAFYCTEPEQAIVGPGICRVTYGGFLLSYPPRRVLDVWGDRDYHVAERKSEVLLLAALDYSEERIVVHVAPRPPRAAMHRLAARLGLKILYVPIGTLSPTTMKRIRVMHILSGHDKREIAQDFIW